MEFTSYQLVGNNTASLNTGSYLNRTEYSLFTKNFVTDLWYGFSSNDVIELGIWDRDENLISWQTINQSKSYNEIYLSYINTLNYPVTYSYKELNSEFILYKNDKILVNPTTQISSSFQILSGSYYLTYNFVREMAGTINSPLVIKEISPSRKELKLVPITNYDLTYTAFCQKKILLKDVVALYLQTLKKCPYDQIYTKISPYYMDQINTIKSLFFINNDADMLLFLRNLYEDVYIYTSIPKILPSGAQGINQSLIRIQGIQTYFNNYLLSNSEVIVGFSDIDAFFKSVVYGVINRKFNPIGSNPEQKYVDAKSFLYDFFLKYYYDPITKLLTDTYNEKYYSPLKNALNIGENKLFPIINTGMMDERVDINDPLTLLIKLQNELPSNLDIQSKCWITNISFTPYVISSIIKSDKNNISYKIGPPNFSIPIPNASLTNTNLTYTADDLTYNDELSREITINKNIEELSVDYTNFQNFVVFSSAELRLKIFKNKIINLSSYSSSLETLENKNILFYSASASVYPYYTQEYDKLQGQLNDIVNSFDGYESYLYRTGDYTYSNGQFVSASYVVEMDTSASYYDKYNRDSLINNCPEHILVEPSNDEYIVFLSMIGHFFDDIYIYIANVPSERQIKNDAVSEFTRRIVDYMLETFGWNVDDTLDQSNILNNYLTSDQQIDLNSMSSEDRLKTIRNRILVNLPQIYKTKGTEESIKLILSCYGIPSSLLSIREYGGINYTNDKASYTTYERVYMRQWDTSSIYDTYYMNNPGGCHTYLFKFSIEDSSVYQYNQEQILFGRINTGVSAQTITASGDWAVGFVRVPKQNSGKLFFRIGYKGYETFKMYSSEFPLFDNNIYSVMLRKNSVDDGFEYTSNIDSVPVIYDLYVQRNEYGNQILQLSSSKICYDTASNINFENSGVLALVGWFSWNNGQGYTGTFDKFQVWHDPILNNNFEDYVNNINGYSFSGSGVIPHQSLIFRMHTDYPENQRQFPPGSPPIMGVTSTNWLGIWKNGNPYYAVSSSKKLDAVYGTYVNVDYMVNWGAWSGSLQLVYNTRSCIFESQSAYPYQYKVIDYPSTWGISKYGPNKFRNEKIQYVSQSVEARFDSNEKSTYNKYDKNSYDSNQIGLFVDPQDFKNKDIIRYYGNYDFMDVIGNPSNQYSSSYDSLKLFRSQYAAAKNEFSGSQTLFNELCILYKLYFNKSIFQAIKNVVPARTNTLVGVLIEPTVLERPKYQSKPLYSEVNTGSVYYADITASHYFREANTKLVRLSMSYESLENTTKFYSTPTTFESMSLVSMSLNLSYINLPTRDYPVNYGGNYIDTYPDYYQMGHFAGGILTNEELQSLMIGPRANFRMSSNVGVVPFTVNFTLNCTSTDTYEWNFGDNTGRSSVENPSHTFNAVGTYPVTLTACNTQTAVDWCDSSTKTVTVILPTLTVDFTADKVGGVSPLTVIFTNNTTANGTGALTYVWNFGDGDTSAVISPLHTFEAGTYTITLTATYMGLNSTLTTKTKTNYIVVLPES